MAKKNIINKFKGYELKRSNGNTLKFENVKDLMRVLNK
jgi:hypothetical protein